MGLTSVQLLNPEIIRSLNRPWTSWPFTREVFLKSQKNNNNEPYNFLLVTLSNLLSKNMWKIRDWHLKVPHFPTLFTFPQTQLWLTWWVAHKLTFIFHVQSAKEVFVWTDTWDGSTTQFVVAQLKTVYAEQPEMWSRYVERSNSLKTCQWNKLKISFTGFVSPRSSGAVFFFT